MKNQNSFKFIVFAVLLTFFLLCTTITSASQEVTTAIKSTIDQVVDLLKDEKFKDNKGARMAKLREIINPRFSYTQMSMRSLAKHWNDKSNEEKQNFINLFGKLLENSYATKLESYSNEKINYGEEIIKGKYAMVKTEIVRSDGTINVDYKLIQENGDWKVYDFVIEGVSMINNYRSQFSRIIRKNSYEGLKKKLLEKIQNLADNELDG
jgi:phospholipid transport system substrate-binding protein